MEISFKRILESNDYQNQLIRTKFDTNHPTRRLTLDTSCFKKTEEEKLKLANAKLKHKEEMKKFYGKEWKKHLNLPKNKLGKVKIETYQELKGLFKYSSEDTLSGIKVN
jgi:hypothetical protein